MPQVNGRPLILHTVSMKIDDFYTTSTFLPPGPWGQISAQTEEVLREDLFTELRTGPIPGDDDLETALTLTQLVHDDLVRYGTGGNEQMNDAQLNAAQRCLKTVLARHGMTLELPWRAFDGFRTYWLKNEGYGSYQTRRDLLDSFFEPVYTELERLEEASFRAEIAEGVSPRTATGWPGVDVELKELKRRFRSASTPQDYRDVGNRCVAVLEAISGTVYDAEKHLREGETVPPVDKTNQRIGRYVEDSLAGSRNEEIRGIANKVSALAHKVKHSGTPSRRDAGIVADSVVLLANILRRVDQDL